jgi:hypothetical protein
MPLVVVNRNPKRFNDNQLKILVSILPESVANTLTCKDPKGALTAQDIEVWVQDFGPYDVNTKDVEIIIWANSYPERLATLNYRRKLLCHLIKLKLPKEIKGFVWILLQPGSFGEF